LTREGLFCFFKHCLDNMFVAQEAFASSTFKNYAG
jgi:hypothetical protein